MDGEPTLRLDGLTKTFVRRGTGETFVAVDNVSLSVGRAEVVALVGESGSGKSTLARLALRLDEPDSGRITLGGINLTNLHGRALRGARVSMQPIFQDPAGSFNPRRRVDASMFQAMPHLQPAERRSVARDLLERVGLRPADSFLARFPHELSGGQRQRLAVARAIAMDPALIIGDEPLSGADVSIQGQMLNLMADLRRERSLAFLMITHDISIARAFADRVAVMYQGRIVEEGLPEDVLGRPRDAYTRRLVAAVPTLKEAPGAPAYLRPRIDQANRTPIAPNPGAS